MGLDISIRWVRKDAKKTVPARRWDNSVYFEYDEHDVRKYYGDWLQGRGEFRTIREWVRIDRYGQYIPLVGEDYATLIRMIETELNARVEEAQARRAAHPEWYEDDYDDFPWYLEAGTGNVYGLSQLYSMVLKAPLYEAKGWIMELECDW